MKKELLFTLFLLICRFTLSQGPVQELGPMPDAVSETSGLIFYNGKLVTHNDSGNTPQLFEIDTISLEITRTITVANVENIDWEDIAQDEKYIYIGDVGNNRGIRQDLAIYRIAKTDYDSSDEITAEAIAFSYKDQIDFEDNGATDWDAEALFTIDEKLIVLTKQWQSGGTVAYSLPKEPGSYKAERLDSYNTEGLVTGATYNPLDKNLILIGYDTTLQPFLYRITGANNTSIFGGIVGRNSLETGRAQIESIAYINSNTYYFSSEAFSGVNLSFNLASLLFSLQVEDLIIKEHEEEQVELEDGGIIEEEEQENPEIEEAGEENSKETLLLFRSRSSNKLNYRLNLEGQIYGMSVFDISGSRTLILRRNEMRDGQIDISTFARGIYYFTVATKDGLVSKAFAIE